ncbi:MAG: universal stress protein [Chthoniobacterales bacterium]
MKMLLAPLDFSSSTQRVLQTTQRLAKDLNAQVCLLHICEPTEGYVPIGASMELTGSPSMVVVEPDIDGTLSQLEELAEPLRKSGLDVKCKASAGLAVPEIQAQAEEIKADYIVLGSHGHGALFHLFSGSVVTGILKHAPCPVIVTPHRADGN